MLLSITSFFSESIPNVTFLPSICLLYDPLPEISVCIKLHILLYQLHILSTFPVEMGINRLKYLQELGQFYKQCNCTIEAQNSNRRTAFSCRARDTFCILGIIAQYRVYETPIGLGWLTWVDSLMGCIKKWEMLLGRSVTTSPWRRTELRGLSSEWAAPCCKWPRIRKSQEKTMLICLLAFTSCLWVNLCCHCCCHPSLTSNPI